MRGWVGGWEGFAIVLCGGLTGCPVQRSSELNCPSAHTVLQCSSCVLKIASLLSGCHGHFHAAPTAELEPLGANGAVAQTDEQDMGMTYEVGCFITVESCRH